MDEKAPKWQDELHVLEKFLISPWRACKCKDISRQTRLPCCNGEGVFIEADKWGNMWHLDVKTDMCAL